MSDSFIKVHTGKLDRMKRELEGFLETWLRANTIIALWCVEDDTNPFHGTTFLPFVAVKPRDLSMGI